MWARLVEIFDDVAGRRDDRVLVFSGPRPPRAARRRAVPVARALMFSSRDTAEAVLAFIEKREPRFTGE